MPHTAGTLTFDDGYPPMAPTEGNARLLDLYSRGSQSLGFGPVLAVNPDRAGAADVSFVAGRAEMVLDGIGLMGRDGHTPQETADLTTLPSQTKRAALLLLRLARGAGAAQHSRDDNVSAMDKIANNILDAIGHTPMVRINRITRDLSGVTVVAKLETFNPGNSIKDRMAVKMIEDAEAKGLLKPGGTIIEGTSGNTGMGLAIAAVVKGYKCVFTTTDKQSKEKIDALKAFGAEVIICPTNVDPEDPRSYYSVSSRLAEEIPNSWKANQYDNLSNTAAHYEQTGPEIWEQTDGRVTHLVVGVGTGGTVTGVGRYLKERNPADQGLGHRHLRVGVQEIQGNGHLRQARDLSVHHRGHRRRFPAAQRRFQRHRPFREGDRQGRRAHDAAAGARRGHLRRQFGRFGDGRPAAARASTSTTATSSS